MRVESITTTINSPLRLPLVIAQGDTLRVEVTLTGAVLGGWTCELAHNIRDEAEDLIPALVGSIDGEVLSFEIPATMTAYPSGLDPWQWSIRIRQGTEQGTVASGPMTVTPDPTTVQTSNLGLSYVVIPAAQLADLISHLEALHITVAQVATVDAAQDHIDNHPEPDLSGLANQVDLEAHTASPHITAPDQATIAAAQAHLNNHPEPDLSGLASTASLAAHTSKPHITVADQVTIAAAQGHIDNHPEPDLSGLATSASVDAHAAEPHITVPEQVTIAAAQAHLDNHPVQDLTGLATLLELSTHASGPHITAPEQAAIASAQAHIASHPLPSLADLGLTGQVSTHTHDMTAKADATALTAHTTDTAVHLDAGQVTAIGQVANKANQADLDATNTIVAGNTAAISSNSATTTAHTTDAVSHLDAGQVTALGQLSPGGLDLTSAGPVVIDVNDTAHGERYQLVANAAGLQISKVGTSNIFKIGNNGQSIQIGVGFPFSMSGSNLGIDGSITMGGALGVGSITEAERNTIPIDSASALIIHNSTNGQWEKTVAGAWVAL